MPEPDATHQTVTARHTSLNQTAHSGLFQFRGHMEKKMSTDRELLEMAANAAGYVPATQDSGSPFVIFEGDDARGWNPLDDDADALRLAVKLGLFGRQSYNGDDYSRSNRDPYAATRRAIVRAAAEIGKSMK